MEFNVEHVGPVKKKLSIQVPAEIVKAEMTQALNVTRREAKLKGFRPGKAPLDLIKRLYGPQLEQDVAQKLINDTLPEAIQQSGLELASQPTLEESNFQLDEPFSYTVSFEAKPEFEISGYQGLELTRETVAITDEMVDQRLEELRKAFTTTRSIEEARAVAKGDLAVVDYKSFTGDEPVEGGANPSYQLEVGSGRFHEEFEAALVGMGKGESKSVTVTFARIFSIPEWPARKSVST
jgi:trigger factor